MMPSWIWPESTGFTHTHDLASVTIAGRDAIPYLQTKLTADTRPWRPGHGAHGFATDIQGRVLFGADFVGLPGGAARAILPADQVDAAVAHLEKWVILEDVTVSVDTDVRVVTLAPASPLPIPDGVERIDGALGTHLVVPAADVDALLGTLRAAGGHELTRDAWLDQLLLAGVPVAGIDLVVGETIPLEAGAFHAVSFNKGCYLGQEVIERLHSRGRPNKRLLKVTLSSVPSPDALALLDGDDQEVGRIVRWVETRDAIHAFAWVRRRAIDADAPLRTAAGIQATRVDYVGGERPPSARGGAA